MEIIAVIPARSGSKGVVDKNMRHLSGKPLIDWSIQACQRSRLIDRSIISTDSLSYAAHAQKLGAEAPFLRPAEISGDTSSDYEFIDHLLDFLSHTQALPDVIVHIRPTTPVRDPEVIDSAIQEFISNPSVTSLRSVHMMPESAYKCFEIGEANLLQPLGKKTGNLDTANQPRQLFPQTYVANGYVDVLSAAFVKEKKMIHGQKVLAFETPVTVEIDTEDDFDYIEFQISRNIKVKQNLFG